MNVLVLYDKFATYTNTVHEHLAALSKYSVHIHAFCHGQGRVPRIRWQEFDSVVIHYSLRVAFDAIKPGLMRQIAVFAGPKVLFVQDEYDYTERVRQVIEALSISVVYTCVPERMRERVYPAARFPTTRFVTTLTGFVPDALAERGDADWVPLKSRALMVGYRGRALPYWYGDLGQEKQEIAQRFRAVCDERGLACDIEWSDQRRIYGTAWNEFLRNCRATLGTESGSNLFDEFGTLREKFKQFARDNPQALYAQARQAVLGARQEEPIMNQVSPRIFEAISAGTGLILYEGRYSDVVQPDRHFIALKKDFSNVDEVLHKLLDNDFMEAMIRRAYREVVQSGRYSYAQFVRGYDEILGLVHTGAPAAGRAITWQSGLTQAPERLPHVTMNGWTRALWSLLPMHLKARLKPALLKMWQALQRK